MSYESYEKTYISGLAKVQQVKDQSQVFVGLFEIRGKSDQDASLHTTVFELFFILSLGHFLPFHLFVNGKSHL